MLRISYFWSDWNSYATLGVFYTIFSTKVTFLFFPKISLKFLIIRFSTSVAYCSDTYTYIYNCSPRNILELTIMVLRSCGIIYFEYVYSYQVYSLLSRTECRL